MMLEKEANIFFTDLIRKYAATIGFRYEQNDANKDSPPILVRESNFGIERIGDLYLELFNKKLRMTSVFTNHVHAVEDVWIKYYLLLNTVGKSFDSSFLATISSNSRRLSDYIYDPNNTIKWMRTNDRYEEDNTEEGVRRIVDQFTSRVDKYILPTLHRYDNLAAIDRTMNEKPETYFECIHLFTGNGLIFKKMIVAKLAGNPEYQEVCNAMREKILTMEIDANHETSKYLDVWEKLTTELNNT